MIDEKFAMCQAYINGNGSGSNDCIVTSVEIHGNDVRVEYDYTNGHTSWDIPLLDVISWCMLNLDKLAATMIKIDGRL